jgi:alkanesulfonate monooxygenase SsuD/methylene tetrahydromethanopterin reductase-like flavin-dependent oxidoreductase (luciferase family)
VGAGAEQLQFGDLGDEPDQRVRGEMVDEALTVVTRLWTGETAQFEGKYYHIKPTIFRPKPLQQPRIPIWVAGTWPHKRPLARMARWDGMFSLLWGISDPLEQQAHLRQMVDSVLSMRREMLAGSAQKPFDVVVVGATPPDRPGESAAHVSGWAIKCCLYAA